mgnify:CR=1 FL=1
MIAAAPVADPGGDIVDIGNDALGAEQGDEAIDGILCDYGLFCHGTCYAPEFIDGSTVGR